MSNWKRQNPPKAPGFDWEMYRYVPSMAGAIVCLIVFLIMAGLHLWQFVKTKNRIVLFVVVGALCTSTSQISLIIYPLILFSLIRLIGLREST
jgi:hypothetical protein